MKTFDLSAWYWCVAGDESRVWSSAASAWAPIDDAAYVAWLEEGGVTNLIRSEDELCDVLNGPIIAAIETIELKQARPLRELSLGIAPAEGAPSHEARLAALDAEISALRATLLKAPL